MSPGRGVCAVSLVPVTRDGSCPGAVSFSADGCRLPHPSLTTAFLLKPAGLEQSWSWLLVPKSSQSDAGCRWMGWKAWMVLAVGKPLAPTVPSSLTLFIHGLTDSSIGSEC